MFLFEKKPVSTLIGPAVPAHLAPESWPVVDAKLIEMLSVEWIIWAEPVIGCLVNTGEENVLSAPNATSNVSTPPAPVPTPSILT